MRKPQFKSLCMHFQLSYILPYRVSAVILAALFASKHQHVLRVVGRVSPGVWVMPLAFTAASNTVRNEHAAGHVPACSDTHR